MNPSYNRTFDLSAKKRAFLETMLREEGLGSAASHRIPHRTDSGAPPLSFAQQRLWFLDQLAPGNAFYNIPLATRLTGPFNVAALAHSFAAIVRRHDMLRTSFCLRAGQPVQHIVPSLALPLALLDLQGVPADQRDATALHLAIQEAQRPFDLASGPLFRTTLLRLAPTEHLLLLTLHHSIADGWSADVLFRELGQLYSANVTAQLLTLPPLPIQYADYAVWQRHWLQGAVLEQQLTYWRRQLDGAPALLALPTDRPRPAVQTFRGATHPLALPPALRAELLALSRQAGVTLFMTLLAAFQVLLARYSGQDDIVVGTPIANRTHAEIEPLIGFFANTLVLRTDLSGNPSFRALLGRVREVCLGAYAHQDVPFEKLVEELHPERNLSFNPLFQVLFALQDALTEEVKLAGLTTSPYPVSSRMAKIDLSLVIINADQGRVDGLTYNIDLFDATTIANMASHFLRLLEGIVENPDERLSRLPLMTDEEQRQLLVTWNDTKADYPKDMCLHDLFESQVECSPDAVALVFDGPTTNVETRRSGIAQGLSPQSSVLSPEHLTYRELNRRANQLARHLRGLGVGPEVRVGLCVERSPDLLVGLLGILKAGGAFVPLDPAYPQERLAFMLADSQVPVLLIQQRLAKGLPRSTARVVGFDSNWQMITQACTENPFSRTSIDNIAYVIYTSGSTGQPKGVLVSHRGLGNLTATQTRFFDIRPDSRVLQFASLSFDAAVSEICMALLNGAALVLGRQNALMPGPDLLDLLDRHAITIATLPPSVLAALPTANLPALRTIVVAGEAPAPDVLRRWRMAGRRIVNAYGPTEATVCATMGVCPDDGRQPPIGRPLNSTQVYLLDRHMRPVPVGVPGELYIGGIGVARGYLGRPDLTAERFVPNPFAQGMGDGGWGMEDATPIPHPSPPPALRLSPIPRLYRTGDLARYLPDGAIEYLGRIDQQIKLRGFRIELGEIEAVLERHAAVHNAVVTVREMAPGDKRLIAYVVADTSKDTHDEPQNITDDLRQFLQEKLPHYMIPATIVRLDAMPLSPNGKVDRRALPAPEMPRLAADTPSAAPQTALERTIAAIWRQVLHVDAIGPHDNFFDLGGHSLLMAQVHTRLREASVGELSMVDLFQYPSIKALANYLSREQHRPPAAPQRGDGGDKLKQGRSRLKQLLRQRQSMS